MFVGTINQKFEFLTDDNKHFTWKIFDVLHWLRDNPQPMYRISPEDVKIAYMNHEVQRDIDVEYAMTTDIRRPIIIVEHPDGDSNENGITTIMIDGNHRLYKACRLGRGIFAVFIKSKDAKNLLAKE